MNRGRALAMLALCLACAGTAAPSDTADVTEEGLVRVPSSRRAGVYRAPGVPFSQYRRVILGPSVPVEFRSGWQRDHREVSSDDVERIRGDFAKALRTEFAREMVERGGFALAPEPATDTIRIDASISQLDMAVPVPGNFDQRTYARKAGSFKVTVELRDAASGVLIGRIIEYEQTREYQEPQLMNQVLMMEEFRQGLASVARRTREAINVAKTERPR